MIFTCFCSSFISNAGLIFRFFFSLFFFFFTKVCHVLSLSDDLSGGVSLCRVLGLCLVVQNGLLVVRRQGLKPRFVSRIPPFLTSLWCRFIQQYILLCMHNLPLDDVQLSTKSCLKQRHFFKKSCEDKAAIKLVLQSGGQN